MSMNKDLQRAQQNLTERVIRRFWQAMTLSHPQLCVNNGLSVNYHKHITVKQVEEMANVLTKCMVSSEKKKRKRFIATPLFQYYYDPPNKETPHHVSAITLTCFPNHTILSFFDPKGKGSLRPKEELLMLKILAQAIQERTKTPIKIHIYTGDNLQKQDYIGLCQLFSLFYLHQYITIVNKLVNDNQMASHLTWAICYDPNVVVNRIRHKYGHYGPSTLYAFWKENFCRHNHGVGKTQ